jgi:hypothetical protein
MSNIGANDLIYYSDNEGKIYSGGFSVNSIMIKEGLSPIMTLNNVSSTTQHDNISDLFSDLVIPSWTLHHENIKNHNIHNNISKNNLDYDSEGDSDGYISDDLYEKLLGLVTISEKELKGGKKNTRKMKTKIKKNRNTRRNK